MHFLSAIFLLSLATIVAGAELPDFVKVCQRDDPNLGDCLVDAVIAIKGKLVAGLDELKVPSVDPLMVGDIAPFQSGKFTITVTNAVAHGIRNFKFSDVRANVPGETKFQVVFPKMTVVLNYQYTGKVMFMPVSGRGTIDAHLNHVECDMTLVTSLSNNKLVLDSVNVKTHVPSGRFNIKDKNSIKSAAMNIAANTNFRAVIDEYTHVIQSTISNKIKENSRGALDTFTFDQLFPKSSRIQHHRKHWMDKVSPPCIVPGCF